MSYKERAKEVEIHDPLAETQRGYEIVDDIDPYANHLHHTGPLKIFEAERVRIFQEHGMDVSKLAEGLTLFGFVRELVAKYNGQVYRGDKVEVVTTVFQTRPTILSFWHHMRKDGANMVEAIVDAALVNGKGKPVRIPQEVVDKLKSNVD